MPPARQTDSAVVLSSRNVGPAQNGRLALGKFALSETAKPKLLVFIVAYNAEKTLGTVLRRIPSLLSSSYQVEILVIDDASRDSTFEEGHRTRKSGDVPFPVNVLFNPVNQGYGGNQKLGYHYAIQNGFDFVALIHGDGQYAPECLPDLLDPLRSGTASAVFGSRMLIPKGARRGGMPLYKLAGNRILTWIENRLLHANLSEFHSGYRIYSTAALSSIPFDRNSNDFHFDTEIIIQLLTAKLPIVEIPIPTYYGDEICYVNGLSYAWNVIAASVKARLQEMGLFYDRKFDCSPPTVSQYVQKLTFTSPHTLCLERVTGGAKVLDLGCAGGYMGAELSRKRNCSVTGADVFPVVEPGLDRFLLHDLNSGPPSVDWNSYDYVIMLDVIEHLTQPEAFLEALRQALATNPRGEVMISTANVGFFVIRAMMLLGQFNYGKRGILDLTHTRLFTFASFRRAVTQSGFVILETRGVPGPFPLALGDNIASRLLVRINEFLIKFSKELFSYQIFVRIKPQPSLESLLRAAVEQSRLRAYETEVLASREFGVRAPPP